MQFKMQDKMHLEQTQLCAHRRSKHMERHEEEEHEQDQINNNSKNKKTTIAINIKNY